MSRSKQAAIVVGSALLLAAGVGVGYWFALSRTPATANATASHGAASDHQRILYWYDPMLPQERYDKPGKSSMGMELIPKYAGESGTGGVMIAPEVRQNLGMRTVVVQRGRLPTAMSVPGTIGWDLRQERVVSARVDSIVERLFVKAPFEPVHAGQALASVLSPAWSTALAENRALLQADSSAARALQSASRERLHALGLQAGAATGRGGSITLASPIDGVVSEIGIREGESAPAGTLLFRINGTATMWLEAAVPQAGSAGIAAGTPVEARVDAIPAEVFRGRVESLLPQVEPSSRTQRARIVLDNPHGLLAPGMFAQVTLKPDNDVELPLVPTDALIGSGTQARVIVLGDDGMFHPVAVQTGRSSGGMTEVVSGLKGGERVVASGQFLIDSEASLSGALQRMEMQDHAPAPQPHRPDSSSKTQGSSDPSMSAAKPISPDPHVHGNEPTLTAGRGGAA